MSNKTYSQQKWCDNSKSINLLPTQMTRTGKKERQVKRRETRRKREKKERRKKKKKKKKI